MPKKILLSLMAALMISNIAASTEFPSFVVPKPQETLPAGAEQILRSAHATGDKVRFTIVLETLRAAYPNQANLITIKASELAPKWLDTAVVTQAKAEKKAVEKAYAKAKAAEDKRFFDPKLWNLQAEVGAGNTSGDTKETSIAMGLSMKRKFGTKWEHILDIDYDLKRSEGETKRKRYLAKYDMLWRPWDKAFILNHAEVIFDKFSGYDYQIVENMGIGYQFYSTDALKFRIDVGPGLRMTKSLNTGLTDTEFLARVSGDLYWKISKNLSFKDKISYYVAQNSNTLENKSELSAKINSSLAARMGFEVKYDSLAPFGTSAWDTIARVTLVYDF